MTEDDWVQAVHRDIYIAAEAAPRPMHLFLQYLKDNKQGKKLYSEKIGGETIHYLNQTVNATCSKRLQCQNNTQD